MYAIRKQLMSLNVVVSFSFSFLFFFLGNEVVWLKVVLREIFGMKSLEVISIT